MVFKTKIVNLFIDELGSANPKTTTSTVYVLCACMVTDYSRENLRIIADQIKFKYWGKTNIIFHSREIGRKEGIFSILKNDSTNREFEKDLFKFLRNGNYKLLTVVVDKAQAIKKNWSETTVYQRTAKEIVRSFLLSLLARGNIKGRLVVESVTSEKDFFFHKAVGFYLSNGFKGLLVGYRQIQDILTEVSFVTKKNFDIEEQISDLLAYGIKLKFEKRDTKLSSRYEKEIIKTVNQKLFVMDKNTGPKKKKFYSEVNSFKVIP